MISRFYLVKIQRQAGKGGPLSLPEDNLQPPTGPALHRACQRPLESTPMSCGKSNPAARGCTLPGCVCKVSSGADLRFEWRLRVEEEKGVIVVFMSGQ